MSTATITRPALTDAPFAWEPSRRRKFGSHVEMAHVWAQGRIREGESADGRMMFDEGTVYSYGRHFPIARLLPYTFDGRRVVLVTSARYSVSTSKHIGHVGGALRGANVATIHVPDLGAWRATPEQVAATWESLIRNAASYAMGGSARRELDAFQAIFCPLAEIPADPRAWLAGLDRERAERDTVARLQDALDVLGKLAGPSYLRSGVDVSRPDPAACVAYDATSDRIETMLKAVRKAVRLASPYPEHAEAVKAGKAHVKAWTALREGWKAAEETARFEREREERSGKVRDMLDDIRTGGVAERHWHHKGEFAEARLGDACRYGFPAEDIALIAEAVNFDKLEREMENNAYHGRPDWMDFDGFRKAGHEIVTPEDWQNGKGNMGSVGGRGPTLVRRVGDRVETSRGAVVPFAAAVAVYRLAAHCVRTGRGTTSNLRVGHYTLDSVTAEGMATIGCHRLNFAEMERLACREAPEVVKARYPVPAVVA